MWDSWFYEWQGKIHMYYSETCGEEWDSVGHAVSDDFIYWDLRPSFSVKGGVLGEWNHASAKTGMVIRHDNKFYMLIGSTRRLLNILIIVLFLYCRRRLVSGEE